ncbi:MAG: hypothetical protein OHK005_03850 [Candidatus Methylacidiphilales bacterium]
MKSIAALALICFGLLGCTQHKEGFSGPSINMEEPTYQSGLERSQDKPAIEREARVDFFKVRNSF